MKKKRTRRKQSGSGPLLGSDGKPVFSKRQRRQAQIEFREMLKSPEWTAFLEASARYETAARKANLKDRVELARNILGPPLWDGLRNEAQIGSKVRQGRQMSAKRTRQEKWPQYVEAFRQQPKGLPDQTRARKAGDLAGVSHKTVLRAVKALAAHLLHR